MDYLCKYKLGQISSKNEGKYEEGSYPAITDVIDENIDDSDVVEEEEDEESISIVEEAENVAVVGLTGSVSEENESEQKMTPVASALIALAAFLFLLPWIFLIVCQCKNRMKRSEMKAQKEFKQQQLLKISDYGREIRKLIKGPNGEDYADVDQREARFVRVDALAQEKSFSNVKDVKRSQTTCAICVEDFSANDIVRETQCNHVFHSYCLMMWAKSKLWANLRRIGFPACPCCNCSLIEHNAGRS